MTTTVLVVGCGVFGLVLGPVLFTVIDHHGARAVPAPTDYPQASGRARPLAGRACADARRPGNLAARGRLARAKRLVVAGTGILFACTGAYFGPVWHLPAYLYLAATGVAVTLIDLQVKRIPDGIVLPSYVVGGLLLGVASLIAADPVSMVRAAAGGAAMFATYATMALIYPAGMGLGDVKWAGVLGLYLAWLGWPQLALGGVAAFAFAATASVALLATGRARRTSTIPFGPFMLLGALAGVLFGEVIGEWYVGADAA